MPKPYCPPYPPPSPLPKNAAVCWLGTVIAGRKKMGGRLKSCGCCGCCASTDVNVAQARAPIAAAKASAYVRVSDIIFVVVCCLLFVVIPVT